MHSRVTTTNLKCPPPRLGTMLATVNVRKNFDPPDGGDYSAHDQVACMREEPCCELYSGTTEDNIINILIHEEVHHALLTIALRWRDADAFEDTFSDERSVDRPFKDKDYDIDDVILEWCGS